MAEGGHRKKLCLLQASSIPALAPPAILVDLFQNGSFAFYFNAINNAISRTVILNVSTIDGITSTRHITF